MKNLCHRFVSLLLNTYSVYYVKFISSGIGIHHLRVKVAGMSEIISPELEKRVIDRKPLSRNEKYLARQDLTLYSSYKNSRELSMEQAGYLQWAVENANTVWWNDSAEPNQIERLSALPEFVRAYEP